MNKSSKLGFSTHFYNKEHAYVNDTPSTSLEHRERCDLRASQGNLSGSSDFSEHRIPPGQRDETIRCSSPLAVLAYANDESVGISSTQVILFHLSYIVYFVYYSRITHFCNFLLSTTMQKGEQYIFVRS